MKIISLSSENVKRLKAVHVDTKGNPVVVVGGRNAQGKSSLIDSIEFALGGKPKTTRPIRDGEEKAKVVVETEDYKVIRTFTAKGSQLKVQTKDGANYSSPQKLLDKIVGELSFDPQAFATKDKKEQVEILKKVTGLDFDELDKQHKEIYNERKGIGQEVTSLKGQIDAIPEEPVEAVIVSEVAAELEKAQAHNNHIRSLLESIDQRNQLLNQYKADLREAKQKVEQLEQQIESVAGLMASENEELETLEPQQLQEYRDKIAAAEEQNIAAAEYHKRLDLQVELEKQQKAYKEKTAKLTEIQESKQAQLAAVKLPIDGLAFDQDGVTFNGVPFEQSSSAERLQVSLAMGLALNPQLKVILIRDGSLLDEDSMKMVVQMAEEADAQVWLEKVSKSGEGCTIVIEDGEIKGEA